MALHILGRHHLPCLHDLNQDGNTVLHQAILSSVMMETALAIVGKREFSGINARDVDGWTALHLAAESGHLPLCRAILARPDFTVVLAVDNYGRTASQCAHDYGRPDATALLQAAEARERRRE